MILQIDNRKEALKLAHYLIMKGENFNHKSYEGYYDFEVRSSISLSLIPVKFEVV